MTSFIAERKLLYSLKGSEIKKQFAIRIGIPYVVEKDVTRDPTGDSYVGCHVEIAGLDETYSEVYGADSLQAINLASNVAPFLRRLQKKYDLFWSSGEPYFDA